MELSAHRSTQVARVFGVYCGDYPQALLEIHYNACSD